MGVHIVTAAGAERLVSDRSRRAVFLDRDGVINEMVYDAEFGLVDSPQNRDQFRVLPGAAGALRRIKEMGMLSVLVSNQPGVAKGKCTEGGLDAITQEMHRRLEEGGARLDAVYYCLHHPEAVLEEYRVVCDCRKPKAGLLIKASRELGIDLTGSFMVGDGLTDVVAGSAAGCRTVLVGKMKCDNCASMRELGARPDWWANDLLDAVGKIEREIAL